MSYIDIWRRSVVAAVDIPEGVFVNENGTLGGASGVCMQNCNQGEAASVLTVGEVEVKIAEGQTIAAGDWVTGDASGLAVKADAFPNAYCKALTASANGTVRVILK